MGTKRFNVFLILCVVIATVMCGAGCGGVPSNTSENKSGISGSRENSNCDYNGSFKYKMENEYGISYTPHEYYRSFSNMARVKDLDGNILNIDSKSITYGHGIVEITTSDEEYRIITGANNFILFQKLK